MGDIKKKRKLFSRPKKLFDKSRIDDENVIIKKYGLKNKREIWKAKSMISRIRRQAKELIGKDIETQKILFLKLNKMGFDVNNIADILALTENDLLNRRLQTFLVKKKLANSPKQARQLIVHKYIMVDNKIVNIPSFLVSRDLENKISVKPVKTKKIQEKNEEENAVEMGVNE